MSTDFSNDTRSPKQLQLPWPAIFGVAVVILAYFVAQIAASLLVSLYPLLRHWSQTQASDWLDASIRAQFVYVLLAETIILVLIYAWLRRYRTGFEALGLRKFRWRDAGYGLLATPIYFLFYGLVLAALTKLTAVDTGQQQQLGFSNVHGVLSLVITFVSLVILPAFTEEIMVRGLLFGSLRKTMSFVWATLFTSLIFGAAHLPEGGSEGLLWVAAIDTFVLSLVLCYLREKTGSLWAGITLHGIKNGIAFVALFIIGIH